MLQPAVARADGTSGLAVSDFFDFSVYVDADPADIRDWYVSRFLSLRETAFRDPRSFFTRYAELTREQAVPGPSTCGTPSTAPTCTTTSCRRAAGRRRSCARAPTTAWSGSASARSDAPAAPPQSRSLPEDRFTFT